MQVQYLHCDNAGKNIAFEKACKQEGLQLEFEYTAPGMLQQNDSIEQKFTSLFNQVSAMLNDGKFDTYLCNDLWAEAANTAMHLKNNLLMPNRLLSLFQQFSEGNLMQKFGEMCITTYSDNTHHAKLVNFGAPCIWVGYTDGHPTDTYWVFNPKTKKII